MTCQCPVILKCTTVLIIPITIAWTAGHTMRITITTWMMTCIMMIITTTITMTTMQWHKSTSLHKLIKMMITITMTWMMITIIMMMSIIMIIMQMLSLKSMN